MLNILLKMFESVFMRDNGLQFLFFVMSLYVFDIRSNDIEMRSELLLLLLFSERHYRELL